MLFQEAVVDGEHILSLNSSICISKAVLFFFISITLEFTRLRTIHQY